jgi:2-octaprenyl-6-methoxyphenol hydroxylase
LKGEEPEVKTLIIGGGPVGLATALALKHTHVSDDTTILEAAPRDKQINTDRNIALSLASWRFLSRIGVATDALIAKYGAEICAVEVTQQNAFGWLRLDAKDVNEPMLGAAVPYPFLKTALDEAVAAAKINVLWNAEASRIDMQGARACVSLASGEILVADCVVMADGSKATSESLMPMFKSRERDSGQVALIARVQAAKPTTSVAYERFTPGGALALIPRGTGRDALEWTLVWARARAEAERQLALDDASFADEVNAAFGATMGTLSLVSKRTSYPLVWRFVEPRAQGCVAAVGNAAQALHPVAAQGLNLGLRDAQQLAQSLADCGDNVAMALQKFARARGVDRIATFGFTGLLAYGFDRGGWLLDAPRGLGLTALQLVPPLKKEIIRRMAF